ncbi:MAG: peptidase sortase [Marmoricola sp.]|nr:peptidase sortase [Marmoricola sp.]
MTIQVVEAPTPRTVVRTEAPIDGKPPARYPRAEVQLAVSRAMIVIALFAAWILVYLTVFSGFEQNHEQSRLYGRMRTELALGVAPTGAPIAAGAPVAVLSIPRLGLKNEVVVEGTATSQLQDGPGHLRGSVLPGQHGVSELLGRALSFGAPFGSLDTLRAGDPITVTTGQGTFTYLVSGARHQGDPVPAAPAANDGRLTLVSAVGSGFLARLAPSETIYVDATLTGKAVGAGPVTDQIATEQPMSTHVTSGALAFLALNLQLLLIVLLATAWLRARWSSLGGWVVGTPMVLAALWAVSSLASQLLPNLV